MFYDNIIKIVDQCIEDRNPSGRLMQLLSRKYYYHYFFLKLDDPEWIPILLDKGFLNYRADMHDRGYYQPLEFLYKVADKEHKYDKIILGLLNDFKNESQEEDNIQLNDMKVAQICTMLSSEFGSQTIPILIWLLNHPKTSADMILYNIDPFIRRLYDEGFTEEAMHFCKQVFKISNISDDEGKIRIDRLRFKFDRYWVFEFYEKFVPSLNSPDRLDLFKHLIGEFSLALLDLHPRQDDGKYSDYSYITRPAIEEHESNDALSEEHTIIQMMKETLGDLLGESKELCESIQQQVEASF